jgi:hypothetical protein
LKKGWRKRKRGRITRIMADRQMCQNLKFISRDIDFGNLDNI